MTEAVRLAMMANSTARTKLNELQAAETPDAALLGSAQTEYRESEEALRTALLAEDGVETREVDTEERERRELREKSNLVSYVAAAASGVNVDGAEAEYAASRGCAPGFTPIDLLSAPVEHRTVTPVPSGDVQGTSASIAQTIFERTAAGALGVNFPTVAQGTALWPVMTTAPTTATKAKSAAAPATAGAFRLDTRTPRRVTGQFEVRVEDLALLPGMEESLRTALGSALGDQIDEQVFNGAAANFTTDGAIRGLLAQAATVTVAGATETFASGVSRFADLVDGEFAYGWGDLRAVVGSKTFSKYAGTFQSNGDMSLYDYLMGKLGGVRVSNRVPAVASTGQRGLVARTAGSQPIRVPVWAGLQLVRDPFTDAGKGQVKITVYSLIGSPHLPYGQNTIKIVHPKLS